MNRIMPTSGAACLRCDSRTLLARLALPAQFLIGCASRGDDMTSGTASAASTMTSILDTTETSMGGSSSSTSTSSDDSFSNTSWTGAETSGAAGTSGTTGGSACAVDPRSSCTQAVDCSFEAFRCGDVASWWDADGCLRPACGADGECPRGNTCWRSWECDECVPPIMHCFDNEAGACACSGDGVCSSAVCVPDDLLANGACQ
jgi:hypothetical protein